MQFAARLVKSRFYTERSAKLARTLLFAAVIAVPMSLLFHPIAGLIVFAVVFEIQFLRSL